MAVSTEVMTARQEVSFAQLERMAVSVAKSGMFGCKTTEQAMTLMLLAQSEGVHPMRAVQEYHIISGRPAMRADAMLSRFQQAGGRVAWTAHTDARVAGTFSHPAGGTLEIDWTIERAKAAGLAGRDTWKSYPRQMLRARCISEGVRAVYPGIAVGVYTVEEAQDMEPVNVTPAATVAEAVQQTANARPLTAEEVGEHMVAIAAAAPGEPLRVAFGSAWKHAKAAADFVAQHEFQTAYDARKAALADAAEVPS